MSSRTESLQRSRYHHGDLANALAREAAALAREGGPGAVVLREAARRVGVSPTAAYRHFAAHEDLLHAAKVQAHDELADALQRALDADPDDQSARARFRRLGVGYVGFALEEPGWFRTAFCLGGEVEIGKDMTEIEGFRSYQLLSAVLDELVAAGELSPERRAGSEFPVWASIHGLAMLLLDGPLRHLPHEAQTPVRDATTELIFRGLTAN